MSARSRAAELLAERRAYVLGSPDWLWRTRAAWKLLQIARGIPAIRWTDMPAPKPQYRMAAE